MNYLSFLVDDLPLHYYQSELLLFSLNKFTSFKKNNILIHCTTRVNEAFLLFLRENNYRYKVVEPYLDEKYCNKLQQLASFTNLNDDDAVFLVDADTFFLNDPIVNFPQKIGGKVVDAPNPPLGVLSKIFTNAGLGFPKIVQSDWVMEDAYTFETNFNGGFYYVPGKHVLEVDKYWKKWASWLYERRLDLFETKAQQIHVDQVSFSMMLSDLNLDYQVVSSNNNVPIHRETKQRLFDNTKEVSMVHYHRSLNYFGLLSTKLSINPRVDRAIEKINSSIRQKEVCKFYREFNKSFITLPKKTEETQKFEEKFLKLWRTNNDKLELILHVGTPKTGTTTLQFFLDEEYDNLLQENILYPKQYLNSHVPKHQWLVTFLKNGDFKTLFSYLEEIILEAKSKEVRTVFLSTEGIFNHWWDFSNEAKEILRIIAVYCKVKLYITFRDPKSFLESFYKQNLKNPQNSAAECYGKDLSFEEMLKDAWFIKHIDYLGFIQECEMLFGKTNIELFTYSSTIIDDILEKLNVTIKFKKEDKKNVGQSSIGVELLKVINRYNINSKDKKELVSLLQKMDPVLNQYLSLSIVEHSVEKIDELFSLEAKKLKEDYNLFFKK